MKHNHVSYIPNITSVWKEIYRLMRFCVFHKATAVLYYIFQKHAMYISKDALHWMNFCQMIN